MMASKVIWALAIAVLVLGAGAALSQASRSGSRLARAGRSALIINGQCLAPAMVPAADVEVVFRSVDELAFTIETGRVRITETVEGRDLAGFGLVQVAAYPRPTASLINAIGDYLNYHRVPAVNIAGIGAPTKLGQYVQFAQAGLPVPATVYFAKDALAGSYSVIEKQLDLPFVLKALSASGGRYNYLVRYESEFRDHLENPDNAAAGLGRAFSRDQCPDSRNGKCRPGWKGGTGW
jgi:hypothetical protein